MTQRRLHYDGRPHCRHSVLQGGEDRKIQWLEGVGGMGRQEDKVDIVAEAISYRIVGGTAVVAVQDQQLGQGRILRSSMGDEHLLEPFQRHGLIGLSFLGCSE